jgi:Flp pilus assembly protein TadB
MSKERARRRAERLAVLEKKKVAERRRSQRRAFARKLKPRIGRSGRLYRRSRTQRTGIIAVPLAAVALIWLLVPDLALRVILTVVIVVALPMLVVVVLGRKA